MSVIKDDMVSDKITRRDMLPLSFLKKSAYTGSKRSLNYKLEKTEKEVVQDEPDTSDSVNADAAHAEEAASGAEKSVNNAGETAAETAAEPVKITVLRVYSWVGKFAFDATPAEDITSCDMEFSNAGIDAAIDYLNERLNDI